MTTHINRTSTLLTESELTAELGFKGEHPLLLTRRLLAKQRISHFPQPDGTARIEVSALDQFYRRGQPDRNAPPISRGWFDNRDVDFVAGQVERRLMRIIGDGLPEEHPGAERVEVRMTLPLVEALGEPSPEVPAATRANREDRTVDRLTNFADALLVRRIRQTTLRMLMPGNAARAGLPVQRLYGSAQAYRQITQGVMNVLQDEPLTSVMQHYKEPASPSMLQQVAFVLPIAQVASRSDLERLVDIAF